MTLKLRIADTRRAVNLAILDVIRKHKVHPYGSFANGTFHLDIVSWVSHSDIDLTTSNGQGADSALRETIRTDVKTATGLDLRVSLRSKILHDATLSNEQFWLVANVEFVYKLAANGNWAHLGYQYAKLLLRTLGNRVYFGDPFNIDLYSETKLGKEVAGRCLDIKLGLVASTDGLELISSPEAVEINAYLGDMMNRMRHSSLLDLNESLKPVFDTETELREDLAKKYETSFCKLSA